MSILVVGFLFVAIPVVTDAGVEDSGIESNQLPVNHITGLHRPRIDGYIDNLNPPGNLAEWDDSLEEELIFQKSMNETEAVDVHSKWVDGSLYVSFIYPSELDMVGIQIDRDVDGVLSNGDMQLILVNDTLSLNILINGFAIPIDEYLELGPGFDKLIAFSIGQISIGYFNSESHVEIEFAADLLDNLFRSVRKQHELSFNIPWWSEERYESSAYAFIIGSSMGFLGGYPDKPSGVQHLQPSYAEIAGYDTAPFTYREYEPDWFTAYTDIGIDHIEITQTVQTPDNQRRLVADKTTLGRVFLTNPSNQSLNTTVSLTAYRVLQGYGDSVIYSYIGTLHETNFFPKENPDREILEDSCNFLIPTAWIYHSTVKFEARVTIESGDIVDSNWFNNFKSVIVDFEHTHDLNIYCFTVNEGTVDVPDVPTTGWMNQQRSYTRAAYPIADPNFVNFGWEVLGASPGTGDVLLQQLWRIGYLIRAIQDWAHVMPEWLLIVLLASYGLDLSPNDIKNEPPLELIVGFAPNSIPTDTGSILGQGYLEDIGCWVSPSTVSYDYSSMAHEFDHNLGDAGSWGLHSSGTWFGCGAPNPDPDWDNLYNDDEIHDLGWYYKGLVDPTTHDLMTYCRSAQEPARWISEYRWAELFDRFANWDTSSITGNLATSFSLSNMELINSSARIVTGYVTNYDTAFLDPSYEFWGYVDELPPVMNPNASAFLRVSYRDGGSLDIPIEAKFTDHDGFSFNQSYFQFALPDNGQIDGLEVLNDQKDTILASYYETAFNVSGIMLYPSSFTRNMTTTVAWNLTLGNTTNIYTQLEYSNNGVIWYPIGLPTTGTSTLVKFTTLPGGEKCRFRLQIFDGVNTRRIIGPSFYLSNLAPDIEFSHGVVIDSITAGSHLSIAVSADDPEFGEIGENGISWDIHLGGDLQDHGHGNIDSQLVVPGTYEISVTATDLSGVNTTESIFIDVTSPDYLDEATWTKFQEFLDYSPSTTTITTTTTTTSPETNTSPTRFIENPLVIGAAAGSLVTFLVIALVLMFRRR